MKTIILFLALGLAACTGEKEPPPIAPDYRAGKVVQELTREEVLAGIDGVIQSFEDRGNQSVAEKWRKAKRSYLGQSGGLSQSEVQAWLDRAIANGWGSGKTYLPYVLDAMKSRQGGGGGGGGNSQSSIPQWGDGGPLRISPTSATVREGDNVWIGLRVTGGDGTPVCFDGRADIEAILGKYTFRGVGGDFDENGCTSTGEINISDHKVDDNILGPTVRASLTSGSLVFTLTVLEDERSTIWVMRRWGGGLHVLASKPIQGGADLDAELHGGAWGAAEGQILSQRIDGSVFRRAPLYEGAIPDHDCADGSANLRFSVSGFDPDIESYRFRLDPRSINLCR